MLVVCPCRGEYNCIALYFMLSKAQNKYIRSLSHQKFRKEHNAFLAEGDKVVKEWLASGEKIELIVAIKDWADANSLLIAKHPEASLHIVDEAELASLSLLQSSSHALIVAPVPPPKEVKNIHEWAIALDNIQDPGNMGTIIRIADWYGIRQVICSPECVDAYNPKVIQSAMGGHLRVNIFKADLQQLISHCQLPVLAATLGGESVYKIEKHKACILLIGNESKGVSDELLAIATQEVTIPRLGGAESLNAAVSTGILCAILLGDR